MDSPNYIRHAMGWYCVGYTQDPTTLRSAVEGNRISATDFALGFVINHPQAQKEGNYF